MALLPSERQRFYEEDVAGGVSVSEFLGDKIGASVNFIFDRIVQVLEFGVEGAAYSDLSGYPFTFDRSTELSVEPYEILRVTVANQTSGTSGTTVFRLEHRPFGSGTWTSIFTTNCSISNTASDNLVFSSDDVVAPSGVVLPVLNLFSLATGDEIRFILVSAATGAQNLKIRLEVGPL